MGVGGPDSTDKPAAELEREHPSSSKLRADLGVPVPPVAASLGLAALCGAEVAPLALVVPPGERGTAVVARLPEEVDLAP